MNRRSVHAFLLVLFSLYFASCSGDDGPQRMAVHGHVQLDGAPMFAGQIRFIPAGDTTGPAAAATIAEGAYVFTAANGPIAGTHRIEIVAENFYEFEVDDEQGFAAFAESGAIQERQRTRNPVPGRYNVDSSLTRTVEADADNQFDFVLATDGAP